LEILPPQVVVKEAEQQHSPTVRPRAVILQSKKKRGRIIMTFISRTKRGVAVEKQLRNVINLDVLEGVVAVAAEIMTIVHEEEAVIVIPLVTIVATITMIVLEEEVEDGVIDIIAVAVVVVAADVPIEVVAIEVGYTFIPTKKNVSGSKNGGGNAGLVNHSLMWNHPQSSWQKRRHGRHWNGII